jgi:hypothetical protein
MKKLPLITADTFIAHPIINGAVHPSLNLSTWRNPDITEFSTNKKNFTCCMTLDTKKLEKRFAV